MIRKLPKSEGATLGVAVSGKVDSAEENKWIAIFDALIEQHETINILVLLEGKLSYDLDALYGDLKWTFANLKHMNRLAIVSESKVLKWLTAVDKPFGKLAGIDEKHFETSQLQDAWIWAKGETV